MLVGQLQAAQDLVGAGVVVDPAEPGQAEPRQPVLVAKSVQYEPDRPPQVAVRGADAAQRGRAQPRRGVVLLVPGPRGLVRVRVQQYVAVLGDEPEQQPVHQAQQRALEQIRVQVLAEPVVRRMPEEAGAEVGDRVRHAVAELIQGTRPGLDRLDPPLLQPAGRRRGAVRDLETGDVQKPVEQDELVEQLPVEHRLQVDLDERGARQRRGVPEQPELPAVGQRRPTGARHCGSGIPAASTAAAARRRAPDGPGRCPSRPGGPGRAATGA